MTGIFILGTGVLAEEFLSLAEDSGVTVAGFVDNWDPKKKGGQLCGLPVLWFDELPEGSHCICALSTTKRRRFIDQVKERAIFVNLVHPSSIVLPRSFFGAGTVISAGVIVASNTTIGNHVLLNRGVRVGHHTRIADFVTIQPGANIAGLVEIGEASYVGIGAIVIERRKIGKGVTIAAGSVVTMDVPDHVMVAGNPALIKKEGIECR
jgi:sugar O-acyltransferase (sialic acid O-acetyltransferase NeuD family)